MPRPHYTNAPQHLQKRWLGWLTKTDIPIAGGGTMHAAAIGTSQWVERIFADGHWIDAAEIPTPHMDRCAELEAAGEPSGHYRARNAVELDYERRAIGFAEARAHLRDADSFEEVARAKAEAAKRQLDDEAVEVRAAELVAEKQAKALDAARKQARKELAQ